MYEIENWDYQENIQDWEQSHTELDNNWDIQDYFKLDEGIYLKCHPLLYYALMEFLLEVLNEQDKKDHYQFC